MAEYWVSKKQYWCKYCNIWVRDDAPSRRLHDTGLKHQGNKERFIRDLYKGGERAKRDKEAEAQQMARIEQAARASHSSRDGGLYAGRPMATPSGSSSRIRAKPSGDKWSNYSTASQLGLADEEKEMSSFEIEQMIRGRGTSVGEWEEVKETPTPPTAYSADGTPIPTGPVVGEKRGAEALEEEELENWKIEHKPKRPVRDIYDDDDWDPKAALTSLKFKKKGDKSAAPAVAEGSGSTAATAGEATVKDEVKEEGEGEVKEESTEDKKPFKSAGFGRSGFGKVTGEDVGKEAASVKEEPNDVGPKAADAPPGVELEVKPELDPSSAENSTPTLPTELVPPTEPAATAEQGAPAASSMFKKRRPPPSGRKK